MNEGAKNRQFQLPLVPNLFAARRAEEGTNTEEHAADTQNQEVPFAAHEIADVDQELGWRGEFRAEVLEDFAEDRHDLDDEEGGDGHRDADHDDGISHRGFHLLSEAGARFEESGQPVENLGEQTAVLARFHHADEKPIENARMLGNRFMKGFAPLHSSGHVADDVAQALLALRIALVVKRRHGLDQRNACLDHGGQLTGKENQVSFLDGPGFLALLSGNGLLLEGQNHQPPTHQAGYGVILVKGILNTGNDLSGHVAGLVGECDHVYGNYIPYSSYGATPPYLTV